MKARRRVKEVKASKGGEWRHVLYFLPRLHFRRNSSMYRKKNILGVQRQQGGQGEAVKGVHEERVGRGIISSDAFLRR
jgi:hypothetical protein